eukprot:Sspe_Gene.46652::Locus_23383_Transcript_1_1_Confidence_1.000_Length_1514::g.46652::m.46652
MAKEQENHWNTRMWSESDADPARALSIYNDMLSEHVAPDSNTLAALLRAHRALRRFNEVEPLIRRFREEHGVELDCVGYRYYMRCKARHGFPALLSVLNEMEARGITPDAYVLSELLKAAKTLEEGCTAVKRVGTKGVPLDVHTLSSLVRLCPTDADVRNVLERFEKDGVYPNAYVYAAWMGVHRKKEDAARILEIYSEMQKKGVELIPQVLHMVMSAFSIKGDVAQARRTFEESRPMATKSTYNVMLSIYKDHDLFSEAREFFQMAEECNMVDAMSFSILIQTFAIDRDSVGAEREFKRAVDRRGCSHALYSALMHVYKELRNPYGLQSTAERVREAGVEMDGHMFCLLIKSACFYSPPRPRLAEEYFAELEKAGLGCLRTTIPWNTLLTVYKEVADTSGAESVVKRMAATGVKPDRVTQKTLSACYLSAGQPETATQVLKDPRFSSESALGKFQTERWNRRSRRQRPEEADECYPIICD